MSLTKLQAAVYELSDELECGKPTLDIIRPLVHTISEAYLNYAFEEYNKELTPPE